MSEKEIEKAIKELEKYKVNDREEEENKQWLRRREHLVESNIEEARDYYLGLLKFFERALDTQNRYRIEKARGQIIERLGAPTIDDSAFIVDEFIESLDSDEEERMDEWEIFDKWIN